HVGFVAEEQSKLPICPKTLCGVIGYMPDALQKDARLLPPVRLLGYFHFEEDLCNMLIRHIVDIVQICCDAFFNLLFLLRNREIDHVRHGKVLDLPRFRGEAWRWVSVADWRSWRRPPCGCSSLVRPQRSPFLHPGPCAGSAVAHSPCQARAFCAPARACA